MKFESDTNIIEAVKKPEKDKKAEKSQAELRLVLEQKLASLKLSLQDGIKEYEQALKDDLFEDQDGEVAGAGEKRKEVMQKKLTGSLDRAEKLKNKLDSGEELEQELVLDSESLIANFGPLIKEVFGENANLVPELIFPQDLDYPARQADIDETKFGEFTVNPDTQNLDWESLKEKIFIPDLSVLNGKTLTEVADHLIKNYSDKYRLLGLEFWKFMIENPDKVPDQLKDGNYYYNFGSLVRRSGGRWGVPCAEWCGSGWNRSASWLGSVWGSSYRVVLLEI